jgi:hypothetical protein
MKLWLLRRFADRKLREENRVLKEKEAAAVARNVTAYIKGHIEARSLQQALLETQAQVRALQKFIESRLDL